MNKHLLWILLGLCFSSNLRAAGHAISVETAYLSNQSGAGAGLSALFQGSGIRYSQRIVSGLFQGRRGFQDSIGIELGAFYYRAINFAAAGDRFDVFPVLLTTKYEIELASFFHPFVYTGMMKNFCSAPLDRLYAAAGLGAVFPIGQVFAFRAEFGLEGWGAGAALQF